MTNFHFVIHNADEDDLYDADVEAADVQAAVGLLEDEGVYEPGFDTIIRCVDEEGETVDVMPPTPPGGSVDLRQYVLVDMRKSTCPECGQHIYGLAPRAIETASREPFYFLCLCGRIAQAGLSEQIAPREVRS
jgi:hypothetical protein